MREAFATPVCDLRHPRFTETFARVRTGVKELLQAPDHAVVLAAGSGTFGVELVLRSCLHPGDHLLAVVTGSYGERMARLAELAGARVRRVESALGEVVTPERLANELATGEPPAFVSLVHVEPSTGTQIDLEAMASVCRRAGAVPLVDAICSAFALPVRGRLDGLGAVVTASQKGLALPPGMVIALVDPALVERARSVPEARTGFYGRLESWLGESFLFTPPMAHIFAAAVSLARIRAETMVGRVARHQAAARRVRSWARGHGLAPVAAAEGAASETLTALYYPKGRDDAWLRGLRDRRGLELAPGTERRIAGRAFRIGHLGDLPDEHLEAGLEILDEELEAAT